MTDLNPRQKQVLKAIVEGFVKNSQPVGSGYVVEMLPFAMSSATVRSDMGQLTRAGYIQQPHTSAGRIPTDKGYKLYIEMMMKKQRELSLKQQAMLSAHFKRLKNIQERFREAARLLSEMSGQVGLLIDDTNRVYMSGLSNIPKLPEFRDEHFSKEFMDLLEDPMRLKQVAERPRPSSQKPFGNVRVIMGKDNRIIDKGSIVITRFGPRGKKIISIVGPTRMQYGKALSAMSYIARILNEEI